MKGGEQNVISFHNETKESKEAKNFPFAFAFHTNENTLL